MCEGQLLAAQLVLTSTTSPDSHAAFLLETCVIHVLKLEGEKNIELLGARMSSSTIDSLTIQA